MDPLVFIAAIPVLISIFGVIRKQRFYFLLGYFLFALLVVPDEVSRFLADSDVSHLGYATIWILQGILAFPNKLNYDGTKVFKSFGIKTMLSLSIINIFALILIGYMPESLDMDETTSTVARIYHGILAFIPLVGCYLMLSGKIEIKSND